MPYLFSFLSLVLVLTTACSRQNEPPSAPVPSVSGAASGTSEAGALTPALPKPDAPAVVTAPGGPHPQGNLTKEEESAAMPKPGQANDHSSPALDSRNSTGSERK